MIQNEQKEKICQEAYRYWMANIKGIGNVTKKKICAACGGARELYQMSYHQLDSMTFLTFRQKEMILQGKKDWNLTNQYQNFLKERISFVTIEEADYPWLLRQIHDVPYALYYLGELPKEKEEITAMVGARKCSAYGKTYAYVIAKELGKHQQSVVSGLAYGIDGESHKGCLDGGGRTYAFLGCGVDICYPKEHVSLYKRIISQGAVISEYPPHTAPVGSQFPPRNRLISGISKRVIVIEAKEKSGSLITADFALEQGKDIFALPGRISDIMSGGCNRLINQGAGIILSKEQLLCDFMELPDKVAYCNENENAFESINQINQMIQLEKEELLVYSCFDFYAKSIQQVQQETGMNILQVMSYITHLCELGMIQESFKNQYIKIKS